MKPKTICCECGALIHNGPQPDSEASHGFCPRCYGIIMRFLNGEAVTDEELASIQTVGH